MKSVLATRMVLPEGENLSELMIPRPYDIMPWRLPEGVKSLPTPSWEPMQGERASASERMNERTTIKQIQDRVRVETAVRVEINGIAALGYLECASAARGSDRRTGGKSRSPVASTVPSGCQAIQVTAFLPESMAL